MGRNQSIKGTSSEIHDKSQKRSLAKIEYCRQLKVIGEVFEFTTSLNLRI